MVTMVDTRGWGPFLLGSLPLLDDLFLMVWRARGNDPWKLETIALAMGARLMPEHFFPLFRVSTLGG